MNINSFDPGALSPVECQTIDGRPTLIFTRDLRHAPEKVWKAITDPAQQREWAPFISDRDLGQEGPVTLTMNGDASGQGFPSSVLRSVPPTRLEHTWGEDLVVWELTSTPTGTRLVLRQVAKSVDWVPKLAAGWHICVAVMERMLDGKPVGPIVGMNAMNYGWKRIHDDYAKELGIEATPLPPGVVS